MNGSGSVCEGISPEELELQQGYVDLGQQVLHTAHCTLHTAHLIHCTAHLQGDLQTTDLNFLMCGEQLQGFMAVSQTSALHNVYTYY